MEKDIQLKIQELDFSVLYQTKKEQEAYIYDWEPYSWVGSPVFRDWFIAIVILMRALCFR